MNKVIKNLILLVSIMGVGTVLVGARQTPAPGAAPAAPANVSGANIQFETPLYDFGRMRSGAPVKYTYVFTNTGCGLLVINSVQPQCGCTTAGEWTKQVEPGKTGVIPIQFNTAAYNGPVFKQVTVNCNVTNKPMQILQLKGTVYRPYEVIPQMAVLSLAPDAESASVMLTITNNTEEPLLLSAPDVNNRSFTVQLITNQLGKGYQVKVSAAPPLPVGSVQGQMLFKTTSTNSPTIPVTMVANVMPAIMVIPTYINLAPGPLPNAVTSSVMIQNKSATNLVTLSEARVNVPGVGVELRENQPGKSFTAMLAFPQGFEAPAGQQMELSVKTSNPKFPLVKVPVRQMPHAPPAVLPAPAAPTVAPAPTFPLGPPAGPAEPAGKISSAATAPMPPRPRLPSGL